MLCGVPSGARQWGARIDTCLHAQQCLVGLMHYRIIVHLICHESCNLVLQLRCTMTLLHSVLCTLTATLQTAACMLEFLQYRLDCLIC